MKLTEAQTAYLILCCEPNGIQPDDTLRGGRAVIEALAGMGLVEPVFQIGRGHVYFATESGRLAIQEET